MEYIAYLHKDRKSDFGVSFPDFPGCVTAGKTLEEARRMAAEALALHIQGMAEDGETIPEPSTLDDVADDPAMKGAVAFLVSVGLEKTVRVNITARAMIQHQINYTRSSEFEADRIGISTMANAGYDPLGMASFFDYMGRTGPEPSRVNAVQFLIDHPIFSDRVAEAQDRADQIGRIHHEDSWATC